MRCVHWSLNNGSGLAGVAQSLCDAEHVLGLDSVVVPSTIESEAWDAALDADIHVVHSHLPNPVEHKLRTGKKQYRVVWIGHGTPDHVFASSVQEAETGSPWAADPLMLMNHWLQKADARVTFWPRHQWIYQRWVDKGTPVYCVPLGVDKAFWSASTSRGKFAGTPSVLTAENPHTIKWSYDLLTAWSDVAEAIDGGMAKLHALYVVRDQHRAFIPWAYRLDAAFYAFLSASTLDKDSLRNAFQSVDYYIGLVRYGDFNQIGLQANAAGVKTISYAGNAYSDFWITEGDQRTIAKELTAILKGDVQPRKKDPVPDISETASQMKTIYESIC